MYDVDLQPLSPWNSADSHDKYYSSPNKQVKQKVLVKKQKNRQKFIKLKNIGQYKPKTADLTINNNLQLSSRNLQLNCQQKSSNTSRSVKVLRSRIKYLGTETHQRSFKVNQFFGEGLQGLEVSDRVKTLGKAANRFYGKKQFILNRQRNDKASSNPPTIPALCRKLTTIMKIKKQAEKFESQKSKAFQSREKHLNNNYNNERGTMLKKYSQKLIVSFKPSLHERIFQEQITKINIIRQERKHLLDKILSKFE